MALWWPRHRQRAGDVVVLTVEGGGHEALAVGPAPAGAVADDRVLGPAVPQPPGDLDELGRARVAIIVLGVDVTPEIERRLGVVGGDDVPADPPPGQVIGRRQPPRQLVGLVVGGRCGADQPDLMADHPDRGEQRDRVVAQLGEVVGAERRQRGRVGEEHRVDQAALADRGRLDERVDRDGLQRILILHQPAGFVVAARRQEHDEVGLAWRGHGRFPFGRSRQTTPP